MAAATAAATQAAGPGLHAGGFLMTGSSQGSLRTGISGSVLEGKLRRGPEDIRPRRREGCQGVNGWDGLALTSGTTCAPMFQFSRLLASREHVQPGRQDGRGGGGNWRWPMDDRVDYLACTQRDPEPGRVRRITKVSRSEHRDGVHREFIGEGQRRAGRWRPEDHQNLRMEHRGQNGWSGRARPGVRLLVNVNAVAPRNGPAGAQPSSQERLPGRRTPTTGSRVKARRAGGSL